VFILDVQGWSSGCGVVPIYYNERVMEGTVKSDSGAQIREGIKSVGSLGACPETDWAYDITKFAEKPPQPAFKDAPLGKALQYERVPQVLSQVKGCLAAGYPFVFGFTVYESFESDAVAKTGVVPMPAPTEKVLGGHAVVAVGYDDSTQIRGSSCGTRAGRAGEWAAISPYPMPT
jgi:C1A family cysteine protease